MGVTRVVMLSVVFGVFYVMLDVPKRNYHRANYDSLELNDSSIDFFELLEEKLAKPSPNQTSSMKLSSCLNDVHVEHKTGLFTMLVEKTKGPYTTSVVKMLQAARRHIKVPFSSVILELKEKPLHPESRKMVVDAGWSVCEVNGITMTGLPPQYVDQFTKFTIWNMLEMDTIVFLDSDTYPINDITNLFTLRLPPGKKIAAAADSHIGQNSNFNMGMFVIHPNKADYEQLMSYMRGDKSLDFDHRWAEQEFLNVLWRNESYSLDRNYNRILHEMWEKPKLYRKNYHGPQLFRSNLIHFTRPKPWRCSYAQRRHWELHAACEWWLEDLPPIVLSRCLAPAIVNTKVTVWTSVNNASEVDTAVAILRKIKQETTTPFSSVVMTKKGDVLLSKRQRKVLGDAGWAICELAEEKEKAKIELWGMTELDTVVYFDLKAAGDHGTARWVGQQLPTRLSKPIKVGAVATGDGTSFSTSLLVIHPNESDYERLRSFTGTEYNKVEGLLLNTAWKEEWQNIPAPPSSETESREEVTLSLCTNGGDPVRVGKKIAIVSTLDDFDGANPITPEIAVKQLRSAKNHSKIEFASVLMEMEGKPIAKDAREKLQSAGWTVCTLKGITDPRLSIPSLWGLEGLDTVLYLSPRAFVVGDISDLLVTRLRPTRKVGATQEVGDSAVDYSSHVLLLHPRKADYETIRTSFEAASKDTAGSIISTTFSWAVHDIGISYGADMQYSLRRRKRDQEFWRSVKSDVRIAIHTSLLHSDWA